MLCSVDECFSQARARGLCDVHYGRMRRNGDPLITKHHQPLPACTVEGCDRDATSGRARMCLKHQKRTLKHGHPHLTSFRRAEDFADLEERLKLHASIGGANECWEWHGAHTRGGYGVLKSSVARLAHRLAFIVWVGPIPQGALICHTCDNPPCINPQHLFAGTQQDNMRDMVAKGRNR